MGWTLVVRPKTAADDTVLIRPCWALFIDADEFEVTVAVPAQADREVTDVDVAGFLVQLLLTVSRLMYRTEDAFARLRISRARKPAVGGAAVGAIGVAYVMIFGRLMLGRAKPVGVDHYPMPAFFGDGYGVVQRILDGAFYDQFTTLGSVVLLLAFLILAKIAATCLTLGSGGSGGVIAPSLFLGATSGALLGILLRAAGFDAGVGVPFYALIGMGAVLAAVAHAPLAAILILFDVSQTPATILPAMLASVVAVGAARLLFPESIYSLSLRRRGVRVGTGADLTLLRRMTVEQVELDPVVTIATASTLERLLELSGETGAADVVALRPDGTYAGMVTSEDVRTALWKREAIPLLTVHELVRAEIPMVRSTDDLASVLAIFSGYDVARLPVCLSTTPTRAIGLVSRRIADATLSPSADTIASGKQAGDAATARPRSRTTPAAAASGGSAG